MACEQVEIASVPYVSFVANKAAQPGRQLFVRAARLRPALARQRLGRVRPIKLIDMVAPELQRKGAARQA